MWRYFVGAGAGVLLILGGLLWWQNVAVAHHVAPLLPSRLLAQSDPPEGAADDAVPEPPRASEKTREEKRFSRYDHDKDGKVTRDEFLAARHKAFAKLDTNGDGKLSFEEYAIKTETRFAQADDDKSGALTPAEFATTRIQRKAHASPRCPPARPVAEEDQG